MRKLVKILLIAILTCTLLGGAFYVKHNSAQKRLYETLESYGFKDSQIRDIDLKNNRIIYSNITLDNDKFSTIGNIQISKKPKHIVIDDARLTAEWDNDSGFDVSGWKKQALPYSIWQDITLNDGRLDLLTSAGALRFQAKGNIRKQPDGVLKLQAALWGIQHQLKIETLWNGFIYPDGKWLYDIEFKNGGLNLDKIQASRVTGWLNIDKTKDIIPEISGQIDAGKVTIGDLNFTNFSLTLGGGFNLYQLIAKAKIAGFPDMTATLDVNNTATKGSFVNASIETASIDDLLGFLTALQNSDMDTNSFTSLLLTKGNLERLRKNVKSLSYDMLEFQISGPLYDLTGKIIAKKFKDGIEQRNIISLNPGQ